MTTHETTHETKSPLARRSATQAAPGPAAVKAIRATAGLVCAGVLAQAVTAGVFVRQGGHGAWINAHSGVAFVTGLLSLAALVVAVVRWRHATGGRAVVSETAALFVAVVAEIAIGTQIGDLHAAGSHPLLLAIHIPVALVIFGLAVHLATPTRYADPTSSSS